MKLLTCARPASTETKISFLTKNDIFVSVDAGRSAALLLLYFSATIDTTDHSIFFNRLKHWFCVYSNALNLLSSFFSSRSQFVLTSNVKSQSNLLEYGVPHGNVLGSLLYSRYTTPFLFVKSNHPGIQCHFYAIDTQIYLSDSPELASSAFSIIESCILMGDIK